MKKEEESYMPTCGFRTLDLYALSLSDICFPLIREFFGFVFIDFGEGQSNLFLLFASP